MDIKVVLFLGCIALAASKDIKIGKEDGEKILDEKKEASPAIWVQDHNVTVTANDTEVITGVMVTDLRPEKDGEVKIVEGGVGQKNVTIELKSPAVFRGYGFHVEVYAATAEEHTQNNDKIPSHRFNDNQADENRKTNQVHSNKGNEDSSTKMTPVNLATDIKVDKREAIEKSEPSIAPKVSTTTKDLKTPAAKAKDDKDHDDNEHQIVPLIFPTLKPVNTKDIAKLDEKSYPKQEASLPVSDDSKLEVKPTDGLGLSTLAKNINVNTKTTESVISSKTTPAPRNARDTNGATTKKPKIKEDVEVKTSAPANTKVHDMTPYPLLKKDLEKQNDNTKMLGIDKIDDEQTAQQ